MCHNGFSGRESEYDVVQAYDASRGNVKFHMHTIPLIFHGEQFSSPAGDDIDNLAGRLFGKVHCELLHRLMLFSTYLFDDYLRLAYLQLIPLAAHGLYQHREMQYAASVHDPGVGTVGFFHTQCQIFIEFAHQSLIDMP